ncbi:SMI1/KNR4 family protein [Agromyces sp. Root81]|uniref:SMI1/KNR4 family protein n=1 Tax=Agromyces sp. Root81 TaxID=1736601 RepID=UPI0009EBC115|nr:SMI1/KNR4 family protein [Agromyces sp. Root81]
MDISSVVRLGLATRPASEEDLDRVRRRIGADLPCPLEEFYKLTDGFVSPSGIAVYEASSLLERNETAEIEVYAPGYVLFGDDSGGRGFLMSLNDGDGRVFSSDLGDLSPRYFDEDAASLKDWLGLLPG